MNDRLQRIEFFSLYELYLQKNEEFRRAVHARSAPAHLDELRSSINHIFTRLHEKRGFHRRSATDGRSAP
ncbi:hypothetical protein EPD60_08265 [Flaviaesturariibacter flavus]|uniref:Uncharacterized protein n=1 Tax=Flaviaesturariibacter flavus TaxID=2502780 RepID=A0A4R1BAM9_9BACT|nr:hypothetical protein [Flaviaesturariibacter flavus]TCJ14000.1 hypothetical protein EPD60_08265 [Flaviaesturariibacter flavus]